MMSLDYDEKLIGNPRTGVVHSGVTALLDTLCGLVVMTTVQEGTPLATLDLRIDYLRPATPGETIRATAECYKVTGERRLCPWRRLPCHAARRDRPLHRHLHAGRRRFQRRAAVEEPGTRETGGQPC